jgi:hypothetical protein
VVQHGGEVVTERRCGGAEIWATTGVCGPGHNMWDAQMSPGAATDQHCVETGEPEAVLAG